MDAILNNSETTKVSDVEVAIDGPDKLVASLTEIAAIEKTLGVKINTEINTETNKVSVNPPNTLADSNSDDGIDVYTQPSTVVSESSTVVEETTIAVVKTIIENG